MHQVGLYYTEISRCTISKTQKRRPVFLLSVSR